MTPHLDAVVLLPEIVVTSTIAVVFVLDLFAPKRQRGLLTSVSGVGVLVALASVVVLYCTSRHASMVGGSYVVDDFALLAKALLVASTFVVLLMGSPKEWRGEYLVLILSSLLGAVMVVSSRELVTFIVAFELLAIPGYLLTGWRKRSTAGHEGALKFYLLGMIATAIMLYGASLVFGVAGATKFETIAAVFSSPDGNSMLAVVGVLFVLAGMAYKFSAVPLHFWAPDAYQGAPVPVAAYLSVVSKVAGLFAFAEFALVALPGAGHIWAPMLAVMAVATMTVGNVVALRQTDFVRLLAYSSIAQTGYALVPIVVAGSYGGTKDLALESLFEFLAIYAAMNLAAFSVVIAVGSTSIVSLRGLFQTRPAQAVALTVALLSLAGIPPLGGWFAKLVIFRSGIEAGSTVATVLVVIVAVNTAIGLYYYANVIAQMWRPSEDLQPLPRPPLYVFIALASTVAATLVMGVLPGLITHLGEMMRFAS